MYLDTGAVRFMADKPFIFTCGWASPVYNDSRWLISFPRRALGDDGFRGPTIERDIGRDKIDAVAGGETAGIPFAAWVADRLNLPMQYVRKKPKGFGRGAQIEGQLIPASACCWSKTSPPTAEQGQFHQGAARGRRQMRPLLCDFLLRHLSAGQEIFGDLGVTLHDLTTWKDLLAVAKASGKFEAKMLAEVEKFIDDPAGWSKAHGGAATAAE